MVFWMDAPFLECEIEANLVNHTNEVVTLLYTNQSI